MNLRDDDQVSAVALVVESEAQTVAPVAENGGDGSSEAAANPASDGAAGAGDTGTTGNGDSPVS